ncbi:MAG: hypothetical protein QOJ64_173 [Acidobacteriota bacterium]|nr:hypothetical protein [Acidobacteriota bacterium]
MAESASSDEIDLWAHCERVVRARLGPKGTIQRASVSIMANIAEGFGRHSDKEFANYLNIAHGSAAEVLSHLYVALDLSYIDRSSFTMVTDMLDEISRMTLALARHLRTPKL